MSIKFKIVPKVFQNSSRLSPSSTIDFYLETNDWNDYSYFTTYYLHSAGRLSNGTVKLLGMIQIMKIGQKENETNLLGKIFNTNTFTELPENFVSISFSSSLYRNLLEILKTKEERAIFCKSLNMILSTNDRAYALVKDDDCFNKSLLRGTSMDAYVLKEAVNIMSSGHAVYNLLSQDIRFEFSDFTGPVDIRFSRGDQGAITDMLPSRIVAFIGKNGCGKSTLLYRVARLLFADPSLRLRYHGVKSIKPNDIGFSVLIMLSYSAFDNFALPGNSYSDYKIIREGLDTDNTGRLYFCGLRDVKREYDALIDNTKENGEGVNNPVFEAEHCQSHLIKDPSELAHEFGENLRRLQGNTEKWNLWKTLIENIERCCQENFSGLTENSVILRIIDNIEYEDYFTTLSTGWKFILHAMAGILLSIERHALLLFDEPENHIHPPLLSFFLTEIRKILDMYDSVMLIGTHSPVILQELYSENVFVVRRCGDDKSITHPAIQTFGATFGDIQSDVFYLNSDQTIFYDIIDDIIDTNSRIKSIPSMINKVSQVLGIELNPATQSYIAIKLANYVED